MQETSTVKQNTWNSNKSFIHALYFALHKTKTLRVGCISLGLSLVFLYDSSAAAGIIPNKYATPLYGSANFSAGLTPSPLTLSVRAGGETDAAYLGIGSNCRGFIASSQPDFRLNYQASYLGQRQLIFDAYSDFDTTLVISGPNNFWYCNDDFNGSLNPHIVFDSPQSGQYDVWVGNYSMNLASDAQLQITEVSNLSNNPYPSQPQNPSTNPGTNSTVMLANALGTLLGTLINSGSQSSTARTPQPQSVPRGTHTPVVVQNNREDALNQLLAEYGLTRVSCVPGKVFITGVVNDAVCVEPTYNLPAGTYQYNSATQQFIFYP